MNENATKELTQIFFYSNTEDFIALLFELVLNAYDSDILKRLTVISKEWRNYKKHERMGMLSEEVVFRLENRINNKLLDLLPEINDIDDDKIENMKKILKIEKTKQKRTEEKISEFKKYVYKLPAGQKEKLGLIVFDIDEFTQINKAHGYKIGDDILEIIPKLVESSLGSMGDSIVIQKDWFGRDEYIILLMGCNLNELEKIAVQVCNTFSRYEWSSISMNLRVTVSCSFSLFDGEETVENWIIRNLLGIVDAKKRGKNRVESAHAPFVQTSRKKKLAKNYSPRTIQEAYNIKIENLIS